MKTNASLCRLVLALVLLALAVLGSGCAPEHVDVNKPAPDALGSRVVWTAATPSGVTSATGKAVDSYAVMPGQFVRLETDKTIAIGELQASGGADAEVWTTASPDAATPGFVLFRPSPFTHHVLLNPGSAARVHTGAASDPGYAWFALEEDVLAWADAPLGTPFPRIAPAERIDFDALHALGRTLAASVAAAKDHDAATEAARALLRVVGLRVVRALRPVNGFPYFFDNPMEISGAPQIIENDKPSWELVPGKPGTLVAEGPALVHVWARGLRASADENAGLAVYEGSRLRAESSSTIARQIYRHDENEPIEDTPDTVSLRRAVVQVPPGRHVYRLEAQGGTLHVAPMRSRAVTHLEDGLTGIKSETTQLQNAEEGCRAGAAVLCALTYAVEGRDDETLPEDAPYTDVARSGNAEVRTLLRDLASGGPRDPSLALEIAAARGDAAALAKLQSATDGSDDEGLRSAWARAIVRGTHWAIPKSYRAEASWGSVLSDASETPGCSREGIWPEVTPRPVTLPARPYRGAYVVELLAEAPCDGGPPMVLDVDGEELTAEPAERSSSWRIIVRGPQAKIRRVDAGGGHVYAVPGSAETSKTLSCTGRFGHLRAPQIVEGSADLELDGGAPGLDVWVPEGTHDAGLLVRGKGGQLARIDARVKVGVQAIDGEGQKWTRIARVTLPGWAKDGITVKSSARIAVRPLVREPRGEESDASAAASAATASTLEAVPLDEAALIAMSRKLREARAQDRAALYLARAATLASGGAGAAAAEDAAAARALGARGPHGEDAVGWIQSQVRRAHLPIRLPPGLAARGLEADFRPGARRCGGAKGEARTKIDASLTELRALPQDHGWDLHVALRALAAVRENPADPRAPALTARALAGSDWHLVKKYDGRATQVERPRRAHSDLPVEATGELRARVATGAPFGDANFASVTAQRPAKVAIGNTPNVHAHIDYVCVARAAADALGAACPLSVTYGDKRSEALPTRADGSGSVKIPEVARGSNRITLSLRAEPGRWVALARVVYDREVPGTVNVAGVGWVLAPSGEQNRVLLSPGDITAVELEGPAVIRVDALAEPGPPGKVLAVLDGVITEVPTDGAPLVLPAPRGGQLIVRAEGGAATVTVAERIARDDSDSPQDIDVDVGTGGGDEEAEPVSGNGAAGASPSAPVLSAITLDDLHAGWRGIATRSPEPLSDSSSDLGTFEFYTSAQYGTLREGDTASKAPDGYVSEQAGYRRRIETWNLTTDVEGFIHARNGASTYGGLGTFYEDADKLHLRVTGTVEYATQAIGGKQVSTILPNGFIEYSWRATRTFFILPRLGYDGYYTNLHQDPSKLNDVDDLVYNEYRFVRDTFGFLQALFWYTPYFNDIFYLRPRATMDVRQGQLAEMAVRPGALLVFGQFDINAYIDAAWYKGTADPLLGTIHSNSIDVEGGVTLEYNIWHGFGSFDVVPGVSAYGRASDGGWQGFAFVNIYLSKHRGLRDFSSLELDFPEQLADRVPWRGNTLGGGP